MQRKKRMSSTLVFVTILSLTMLFFFAACNGRWTKVEHNPDQGRSNPEQPMSTFPKLDEEWFKSNPILVFESKTLQGFFKSKNITLVTFLSADGFAYPATLGEYKVKATAVSPCADLNSLPGSCKSLNKDHFIQGINQVTLLRTRKNPPCVAITIGGYVIEFDLATGGQCQ